MPLRAVIFDLDQTLLDRTASLGAFLKWQTDGMLKPDLESPPEFISRFVELDNNGRVWKDVVYQRLIEEFAINGWKTEELLAVYESCFCAFSVPRIGVDQAIGELAGSYFLGLISNGKSPFQERNFRALGYSSSFDSIIVSEAVGLRKPDPEIFHLGCSELNVDPKEAVFVGDSPVADISGAREAGLATIFVPTELNPSCEEADETCEDMSYLPAAIAKLGELQ
ncbi:MAG: HAD family hydrolase [Verrucomicrobiales bacterium]|nr:HAD family hydrolase [Verrucomicrobiales bacterium]